MLVWAYDWFSYTLGIAELPRDSLDLTGFAWRTVLRRFFSVRVRAWSE